MRPSPSSIARSTLLVAAAVVLAACSSTGTGEAGPGAEGSGAQTQAKPNPDGKDHGATCSEGAECKSGLCEAGVCAIPTGNPTGADTGGGCGGPQDCKSGVCVEGACAEPSPTDAVLNGDETDIDCGGANAPKCATGGMCKEHGDCATDTCLDGTCKDPAADDGRKNGDETDVDCGGKAAPACGDAKGCGEGSDCTSLVCGGDKTCAAPSYADGVKNGVETDVDCGGDEAHPCAVGEACLVHGDCTTGCGDDKKCATGKSCTQLHGGRTCGPNGTSDCCATAAVGAFTVDRYLVTAGRMRAMVERLGGNVRAFVQTLPGAKWDQGWNNRVPAAAAEADTMLGSFYQKRSCASGTNTGHTYWTAPTPTDYSDFGKDALDDKALNCVPWHVAVAFCAWDGGRLASHDEIRRTYTNNDTTTYPWGNTAINFGVQDPRLNHRYNYVTPNLPANIRRNAGSGTPMDTAFYVSPPGRFPTGNSAAGVADAAGNLLVWARDSATKFVWTGSWEEHNPNLGANSIWASIWPNEPNGYYGIGVRCSR